MPTRLTVSLIRGPDNVRPQTRTVTAGEFTLGRGTEGVDWTLPDPLQLLSRRHCVLALCDGDWCVTDLSGNGTFVNHEEERMGREETRRLRDSDRLRIGSYEFQVQLTEAAPPPAPRSWDTGSPSDNPFDSRSGQPATPPFGPPPFETGVWSDPPSVMSRPPPAPAPMTAAPAEHQPVFDTGIWPSSDRAPDGPPTIPGLSVPIPPPPPPSPPAPVPAGAPPVADAALLAAFLEGAGLPDAVPREPVQSMRALGAAFRAMVIGLREAQLARRTVRSGFRINQTVWGNNPLKVAVSDEDALAALLGAGRPSPVLPARAVEEVLREIALHEVAVAAAMQEAVRALLATIEPDRLREAADQAAGFTLVPLQRKARAWDAYEARHAGIVQALEDDFDSVFGRAFARAYERAIAEVAARGPVPREDR